MEPERIPDSWLISQEAKDTLDTRRFDRKSFKFNGEWEEIYDPYHSGFELLTATSVKMAVLWVVGPCWKRQELSLKRR
jgi:hypothetical protein